jgi:hypothetical protein
MTASQIISEIEVLPPEEQAKVVRFAYRLDAERRLTGAELSGLAERMITSTDPVQTAMLREEMRRNHVRHDALQVLERTQPLAA